MSETTYCTNKKCPKRQECYRYVAALDYRLNDDPLQVYYDPNPEGGENCESFIPLRKRSDHERKGN